MNNALSDTTHSFAPLEGPIAHTLILGTMPGQASLSAVQYYAHPRNAFWPIMQAIISQQPPSFKSVEHMNYTSRCSQLQTQGYAVWDVLASCQRPGSLDSKIERNSEQANDIAGFVSRHPELHTLACNGKTAEKLLTRHCLASLKILQAQGHTLRLVSLPSSSPAMASLSLAMKHQRWTEGLLG